LSSILPSHSPTGFPKYHIPHVDSLKLFGQLSVQRYTRPQSLCRRRGGSNLRSTTPWRLIWAVGTSKFIAINTTPMLRGCTLRKQVHWVPLIANGTFARGSTSSYLYAKRHSFSDSCPNYLRLQPLTQSSRASLDLMQLSHNSLSISPLRTK